MSIPHIAPVPHPRDGYYATNNPYQVNGPKGFTEFKYLEETHDLFVRLDFPGIQKESVIILLEPSKKAVIVTGEAPKESKHDSSHRKYGTATGLICDCCEISNIQCFVGDGVVRLILSKQKINLRVPIFCSCKITNLQNVLFFCLIFVGGARMPTDASPNIIRGYNPEDLSVELLLETSLRCFSIVNVSDIFHGFVLLIPIVAVAGGHPLAHLRGLNPEGCRGTDPFDPAFTGPTIRPHPSVLEGSTSAYETKQLSNGGLYLRIDMPGVPSDGFIVAVDGNGVVTIMGRAPATMHDSNGFYAMNNPYQANGPKGFAEFNQERDCGYPLTLLEPSKKAVTVTGDAAKSSKHDASNRNNNIHTFVEDGVVRLILSKKKIYPHAPNFCSFGGATIPTGDAPVADGTPYVNLLAHFRGLIPKGRRCTDPGDPAFTGPVVLPHPSVLEGPMMPYETKQLSNGGLYMRVDMPGVPSEKFMVAVDGDGVVTIMGRAPVTMHDTSGRTYVAKVANVPRGYDGGRIKLVPKHGVIRLTIPSN
ncbi:HSP20-like chaperone [Arabidopsis thaliana]|uniref:Putative 57 kDa heat shock protein n=1 Tax=Arabidopsis thaliana TaxID=3702 RepID=HSP57_ARATH|nr:HSP20-like chaperone [Arabidopsis thaliana]F4JMH9.1 RecName: Full=Putative 57 kDa heat shock protein [Arabidopsis thaliana]AEE83769.1 HSP20-like chaperone [Arabidopsis thaliana]|eukprot:NP_567505.1 HSP20-like chaperone [Arabidopsis thaliana]